jgi:hypothetical protein
LRTRRIFWLLRSYTKNRTPPPFLTALLFLCLIAGTLTPAQESSPQLSDQRASPSAGTKSEFIAPGIEHIQITRGFKSDTEATGPWFINLLRIDLTKARLRMVHAMDEAVGLETVSSIATRYGALAAVNSGYFRTTGTYRGDSVGIEVLNGKLLSESNNVRAAAGLIERNRKQELIFGHVKFDGQLIAGAHSKHAIDGLNRPRADNELIVFTPEFHRTTLTEPSGLELIVRRGRVVERRDLKGSSVIPFDGYVISVAGTARQWASEKLSVGTRVKLNLVWSPTETEAADSWKQAANIIGGGPLAMNLYIRQLNQPGAVPHLCWRPASDGVQAYIITTCTTSSSSLRYKTDLQPFVGGLDVINRLNPITFTRKREGTRDVGLAAEEVEKAEPLLAFRNDKGEIEGVKYELLGVVFINAFKEQQAQTRRQQELINQQQTQLARQGQQINALRKLVLNMRGNRRIHQKTARLRID